MFIDDASQETATGTASPTRPVWLVSQEPAALRPLEATLEALNRRVQIVRIDNPAKAIEDAAAAAPGLCFLDWSSGSDAGRRGLDLLRSLAADVAVVVVGDNASLPTIAETLAAGAWDRIALDHGEENIWAQAERAMDMAERQHRLADADRHLLAQQRRLDVLTSDGRDASARLNAGVIEQARPGFARLLGVESVDAVNETALETWLPGDERVSFVTALAQASDPSHEADVSIVLHPSFAPGSQAVRALIPRVGADAELVDIVLHKTDDRQHSLRDATRRVPADGRMALHQVLAQTAGRAQTHVLGLVFLKVDDIARLQAEHGLAHSDLLLQEAGLFLLDTLRGNDRCFRFGAGEYALVLERASREQVGSAAQRILSAFREELFGDAQHSQHLSASIAHALLGVDGPDNDRCLLSVVQTAGDLRARGGNDVVDCSQPAPRANASEDDSDWSTRLRQALVQDRFSLAYQNITSLAGDTRAYFDVLLRYIDDQGALIRPGEFLPAASQAGLLPEIDRWVIRRAVSVIEQQMARDVHISLFIKLSSDTLVGCRAFLDWVRQELADMSAPRTSLIFSIRDQDMRNHATETKHLIATLINLGFRTAVTHFGNTPATNQLVDSLLVSFIKLSPEFAREMAGSNTDDSQLMRAIASARERDIPLIAEQIEDANSMARLWQAGVNYVQGHFIQEPDTEALTHSDLSRR